MPEPRERRRARGVGFSTRLGCPTQEADASPGGYHVLVDEAQACLAHLLGARCSSADVAAVTHFQAMIGPIFQPSEVVKRLESIETLATGIVLSELWFTGANQSFVLVPYANHNVVFSSSFGTSTLFDPSFTCGSDIVAQFTGDPRGALDTSCASQMQPPAFAGTSALANMVFGTTDFWQ